MRPVQIKIVNKHLFIKWNDASESMIKLANLRRNCPCALCISEREEQGNSYIPIYSEEQLAIKDIQLVGKYAVSVWWKDDHNTGIYVFEHLTKLSEKFPNCNQ
jgi:DUF971 family protein